MNINKNTIALSCAFGAGIGSGFVLGFDAARRQLKQNVGKAIPVLAERLEGVLRMALDRNIPIENLADEIQETADMFGQALIDAVKS